MLYIKLRTDLAHHPAVVLLGDTLDNDAAMGTWVLSETTVRHIDDEGHVQPDCLEASKPAVRAVVITALYQIWSIAAIYGVVGGKVIAIEGAHSDYIDACCGVPGMAAAMESAGLLSPDPSGVQLLMDDLWQIVGKRKSR